MLKRLLPGLLLGTLALTLWNGSAADGQSRSAAVLALQLLPLLLLAAQLLADAGPAVARAARRPYMRPPAYQAYPPFHEDHWRYEMWNQQKYYRGSHFWLDQF